MHIDFPWSFDAGGRTASIDHEGHVKDMLELVLFTDLGERVNRPGFGCGLRQLVFAPNSPDLATALKFTMKAAIDRELADVLHLGTLRVEAEDAALRVEVTYTVLRSGVRDRLVTGGAP